MAACILLLVGLFVALFVWRAVLRNRVDREIAQIKTDGYPISLDEIERIEMTRATNIAIQHLNKALAALVVSTNFNFSDLEEEWKGKRSLTNQSADKLAGYLKDNSRVFQPLEAALAYRHAVFLLNWAAGASMLIPHVAKERQLSQLLAAAAIDSTIRKDPTGAAEHINQMLGLIRLVEREPIMVSQLVRLAMIGTAFNSTEQLLNHLDVPEAKTRELQEAFLHAVDLEFMKLAFLSERAFGLHFYNTGPQQLGLPKPGQVLFTLARGTGLMDSDRLFYLRLLKQMVDLCASGYPAAYDQALAIQADADIKLQGTTSDDGMMPALTFRKLPRLSGFLVPALAKAMEKHAAATARARLAAIALELNLIRQKQGSYPAELAFISPGFSPQTMQDPFNGKPIIYRKTETGFLLYSVGPDRADDGGKVRDKGEPGRVRTLDRAIQTGSDIVLKVERF